MAENTRWRLGSVNGGAENLLHIQVAIFLLESKLKILGLLLQHCRRRKDAPLRGACGTGKPLTMVPYSGFKPSLDETAKPGWSLEFG